MSLGVEKRFKILKKEAKQLEKAQRVEKGNQNYGIRHQNTDICPPGTPVVSQGPNRGAGG